MLDDGAIGTTAVFIKTVSEADVVLFAGISGDFSENHTNEDFMSTTRYGRRIAHGALIVAFMSTASARLIDKLGVTAVTLGYDGIRFLKPVFFGDTVRVHFRLTEVLKAGSRGSSQIEVTNNRGEVVAVGTHLLHVLDEVESVEK
jgi:3-hydroxybutyryl-CoA dehydratase